MYAYPCLFFNVLLIRPQCQPSDVLAPNNYLLRMTYFEFCQSILQYGIIGWVGTYKNTNTTALHSTKISIENNST